MKTKFDLYKNKINDLLKDKNIAVKIIATPFLVASATTAYMVTGIASGTTYVVKKTFKLDKSSFSTKIEYKEINTDAELTSEVDVNSLKIFEETLRSNGETVEDEEEDEETDELIVGQMPGLHAHVQAIKKRNNLPLVDKELIRRKEEEKERLQRVKDKLLNNKPFTTEDELECTITREERLKKLIDLGYVSPTKGKIVLEEKEPEAPSLRGVPIDIDRDLAREETIEQIITQALVEELDQEYDFLSNELLDDLISEGVHSKELTEEIDKMSEKELEKTMEMQLAISAAESFEEAQENTEFEIKHSDVIVEQTTEKEILIEWKEEEKEEDKTPGAKPKNWCAGYAIPRRSLLDKPKGHANKESLELEAKAKADEIDEVFKNFSVGARVINYDIGPTVTSFQIEVDAGTKITKITKLEDNIKMTLQAKDIRIQAPIPGKSYVGIETPNNVRKTVLFSETLEQSIGKKGELLITIGQDTLGNVMTFDLAKAPHMLIAGSTGSGKSVAINTIIASIILKYKPEEVKMILVDPKMVEFTPYHNIPHLITPVITSPGDANLALKQAVNEMERRYRLMAENGVRNIVELNEKVKEKIPYMVVIIDELADLMMVAAKEVEESIMRITQKARAAGIHMIVATQRPSTDIITGVIKSNIPSRIAFTVASSIDSRTILDQTGAEKLVGMGDMLVSLYGQLPQRGQGSYISSEEVDKITNEAKRQCSPYYEIEVKDDTYSNIAMGPLIDENDPLYIAAKRVVIQQKKASTSLLQRYLSIGYNKAASVIETLEANGVVGPQNGSKPREVLVEE